MRRFVSRALLLSFPLVLAGVAVAAEPTVAAAAAADPVPQTLRAQLERDFPNIPVRAVTQSPVPGLYEVIAGGDVVYFTADGRYMFQGELIDMTARQSLTEVTRNQVRAELLAAVPAADLVVYAPKGEAKHHMTVFTDVTCPYCRKLHEELPELNKAGVEVRYVLYNRAGLSGKGFEDMRSAMCAKDPQAALDRLMKNQSIDLNACDNHPLRKNLELGQRMGVEGTPFILLDNGIAVPGYRPAKELLPLFAVK